MNKRGSEAEAGAAETSAEAGTQPDAAAAETGGGRKGRRMRGRGVQEEAELQGQARLPPSPSTPLPTHPATPRPALVPCHLKAQAPPYQATAPVGGADAGTEGTEGWGGRGGKRRGGKRRGIRSQFRRLALASSSPHLPAILLPIPCYSPASRHSSCRRHIARLCTLPAT